MSFLHAHYKHAPTQTHAEEFFLFIHLLKTVAADVPMNRLYVHMYKCCSLLKHYIKFCVSQYSRPKKNNEMEWNDKISSKSFKIGNGINCSFSTHTERVKSVLLAVFMISNKRNEIKMFNQSEMKQEHEQKRLPFAKFYAEWQFSVKFSHIACDE